MPVAGGVSGLVGRCAVPDGGGQEQGGGRMSVMDWLAVGLFVVGLVLPWVVVYVSLVRGDAPRGRR